MFVSEKTQRGPLDENWLEEYSAACLVGSNPDLHLKIGEIHKEKSLNPKRILTTFGDSSFTFSLRVGCVLICAGIKKFLFLNLLL